MASFTFFDSVGRYAAFKAGVCVAGWRSVFCDVVVPFRCRRKVARRMTNGYKSTLRRIFLRVTFISEAITTVTDKQFLGTQDSLGFYYMPCPGSRVSLALFTTIATNDHENDTSMEKSGSDRGEATPVKPGVRSRFHQPAQWILLLYQMDNGE